MPVSVKWAGRLGNAVIKYAVARVFAENNDLELLSPFPWPNFIGTTPCASGAREAGKTYAETTHFSDENLPNMAYRHYRNGGNFEMDGYMQYSNELLWPFRNHIKDFFLYPSVSYDRYGEMQLDYNKMVPWNALPTNEDDLIVHVRLTDGATLGGENHVVHPSWHETILEKEARNYRRVLVVTDDPAARGMFEVFKKYGAKIQSGTVPQDYLTILTARNVVMAPSTFSWTACFLGFCVRAWVHDPFVTLPNVKLDWPGATKVRGGFINGRCW